MHPDITYSETWCTLNNFLQYLFVCLYKVKQDSNILDNFQFHTFKQFWITSGSRLNWLSWNIRMIGQIDFSSCPINSGGAIEWRAVALLIHLHKRWVSIFYVKNKKWIFFWKTKLLNKNHLWQSNIPKILTKLWNWPFCYGFIMYIMNKSN